MAKHGQKAIPITDQVRGCVDGRLGNAWQAEGYASDERGAQPGLCFAAHLLYYLVRTHCFTDGNKRIGWISAMAVLGSLGLTVRSSDDDAEALVMRVSDTSREDCIRNGFEVVRWFADRLEAVEN